MSRTRLKILSLNTHKGFSSFNARFVLHELRQAIRSISADLVFLQEVQGEHSTKATKHIGWPDAAQYEFLADKIWKEFAYGKNSVYPEGHHGNAILSKFPILAYRQMDLTNYKLEQRGFLHCEIEIPKRKIILHSICVHLGLLTRHRKKQFQKIVHYIHEKIPKDAPLIVAGDFNDWSQKAQKEFAEPLGMIEAFATAHGKLPKSFPAFLPILKLDRIYLRGIRPRSAKVYFEGHWANLSDHAALFTEVDLDAHLD